MYLIKNYQDRSDTWDNDTRKRFELVKKLSNNFTVENATAMELDKLLVEQIELEDKPPSTKPAPQRKTQASPTREDNKLKAMEDSFKELFDELSKRKPSAGVDMESLKSGIETAIRNSRIGFQQLDEDLQQRIAVQPQTIKIEIPKSPAATMTKPPIATFQLILDDILMGNNVMLIGGAGTGKTYLAEEVISKQALGREYVTINCSQWTSPTEIIGGQTMDGYVEGKLIEAWKNGHVLILDELPKIDPNTAGLFNDALAKTKVKDAVIFNSRRERFTKHKHFACIATGNIYPNNESIAYGANNKQDLSLLDRFSGSVYFIEKNPEIERLILRNDMLWSICDKLREAVETSRYEAQLSLRFMQNARDSYNLEMARSKSGSSNSVKANAGKTFREAINSYLSTFTEVQQKNLKEKIRYDQLLENYQYRSLNIDKKVF